MRIIIFSLILSAFTSFSQRDWKLYTEISQAVHWNVFTETNLSLGVSFKKEKYSIIPTLHYQFGGNLKINWTNNVTPAYGMNYHLIGLGNKFRFMEARIYSPSLGLILMKEIKSNYAGKYLKSSAYGYRFVPSNHYVTEYPNNGSTDKYFAYYYVSTPLLASFSFGNEFRITQSLYVNLNIGYSIRAVKARRKYWFEYEPEPPPNTLDRHSFKDVDWKHYLDASIGVNYTFPLTKKKE